MALGFRVLGGLGAYKGLGFRVYLGVLRRFELRLSGLRSFQSSECQGHRAATERRELETPSPKPKPPKDTNFLGASTISNNTILEVPYYIYSIMYPKALF